MTTSRSGSPKKKASARPARYFDLYAPGTAAISAVRPLRPKRRQYIQVKSWSVDAVTGQTSARKTPAISTSFTKDGDSLFSAKVYRPQATKRPSQTEKALARTEQELQKHLQRSVDALSHNRRRPSRRIALRVLQLLLVLVVVAACFQIGLQIGRG